MTASKRIAVVTGAGNGIGGEVVRLLAMRGHPLALVDYDAKALSLVEAKLADLGLAIPPHLYELDVRRSVDVNAVFKAIAVEVGPVDILVNCVGGSSPPTPIDELDDAGWAAAFELNVNGTFYCTRAVVPTMKRNRWGRIVNVSSVAGRTRTLFGGVQYAAAKAAVIGFTRQCAFELGKFGITANVVTPGITLSERVARRWSEREDREHILSLVPLGRAAACEEIAPAISFLCSEEASYITGATLDANGGLHIG